MLPKNDLQGHSRSLALVPYDFNGRRARAITLRQLSFLFSLRRKNKRSKNFDKRPSRRQKIVRRSQYRGKAVDNGLSVGEVVQFLLYGKNASSV